MFCHLKKILTVQIGTVGVGNPILSFFHVPYEGIVNPPFYLSPSRGIPGRGRP